MFSAALKSAINTCGHHCAQDMPEELIEDVTIMAETAIDGHRLSTTGFVWENFELHLLIHMHGYDAVLREVEKITVYA